METQTIDLKKVAAHEAAQWIPEHGTVGLGAGTTIAYLVDMLDPNRKNLSITTSSQQTYKLLEEKGFRPIPINSLSAIDLYFDGCDEIDHELNALKSGGGIHTHEKLLASMAREFIILADETKWVEKFSPDCPLVLELIPESESFVRARLDPRKDISDIRLRETKDQMGPWITGNGNILLDIWFTEWPAPAGLNESLKSITGILETSLFYQMCKKAVIATKQGVKLVEQIRNILLK